MRIVAILICLALLAGAAWHAAMRGTDQKWFLGAPQIQQIVDEGVRSSVVKFATHPIDIRTDGRNVRLAGPVNSEAERQKIVAATRSVRFLAELDDDLRVLPKAEPFLFQAVLQDDGSVVLTGNVPNRSIHETILAQARSVADGAVVSDRLVMAAGVPDGDWAGMSGAGIAALSYLREGQVQISGSQALVSGSATDIDAAQRLIEIVNTAPMGDWQVQINGALPVAREYVFSAMKMEDGSVILHGNAPNEEVRDVLLEAAGAISSEAVSGSLELADGMPVQEWPDKIASAISALGFASTGLLEVTGEKVSLTAEVESDDDLARLLPVLQEDWQTDISVRNPTPDAKLQLKLTQDGVLIAEGLLPEGLDPAGFEAALPGISENRIDPRQRGRPSDWSAPLEGLEIVLPRLVSATAMIEGTSVSVTGKLRRGFSADGAEAALKSALERDWNLELDLVESAPLAELVFSKQSQGISVSGVLPLGLDAPDALTLLGDNASGEGLSGGGEGDPVAWVSALSTTRQTLIRFADATGRISEGQIEIAGRLLPGYPTSDMQGWSSERMPEQWTIGISAEELEPSEGDQRVSLITGQAQNFRRGYWLPNVEFVVSTEQCRAEVDKALEQESIEFVTASARLDQKGYTLLNRLAAVAVRCLNSSDLRLEISGHTDSVGNDDNNLILSQQRADAVRNALVDRGVRSDAVIALGYGEAQPVETNDTEEGRARNRRIDFAWSLQTN